MNLNGMLKENSLKNKTILVTGGATGLGKSMSKSFNDEPQLKLVLNDNQTIVQLNTMFEKLDQKLSFIYQNLDKKIDRGIQSSEDNNGILQDIYTDGLPCNK